MTEKLEATSGIEPLHRGFADRTHAQGETPVVLSDDHALPGSTVSGTVTPIPVDAGREPQGLEQGPIEAIPASSRAGVTVGGLELCAGWEGPVIHACKHPCWSRFHEPRFFIITGDDDLWLDMVDARDPEYFSVSMFRAALSFIGARPDQNVLIHCNKGLSRAPSIALLWEARNGRLPNGSYAEARREWERTRDYLPGSGISAFLEQHWSELC